MAQKKREVKGLLRLVGPRVCFQTPCFFECVFCFGAAVSCAELDFASGPTAEYFILVGNRIDGHWIFWGLDDWRRSFWQ